VHQLSSKSFYIIHIKTPSLEYDNFFDELDKKSYLNPAYPVNPVKKRSE